jgi:hypothetical protein
MPFGTPAITVRLGQLIIRRFNMTASILGTWKLVSASSSVVGGDRNDTPFGPNPTGFLTYTQDGRMTAIISYGERKHLSSSDSHSAPVQEQAEAFRTFLAYGGRYTFNPDKVIHHVEICSIQDWVGTDQIRSIKFEGGQIVLAAPPMSVDGEFRTFELIWQRLPKNSR